MMLHIVLGFQSLFNVKFITMVEVTSKGRECIPKGLTKKGLRCFDWLNKVFLKSRRKKNIHGPVAA